MKITTTLAVAVGLLGLAACKQSPTENKADQIEANAENTATMIEANADNAAENIQANADNTAAAVPTPATTRPTPCATVQPTHTDPYGKEARHDRALADKGAPFFAPLAHFVADAERLAVDG